MVRAGPGPGQALGQRQLLAFLPASIPSSPRVLGQLQGQHGLLERLSQKLWFGPGSAVGQLGSETGGFIFCVCPAGGLGSALQAIFWTPRRTQTTAVSVGHAG